MITLGIETSCDETAVALFDSSKGLIGEAVFSQIELHGEYGGVIPELASRDHCQKIIQIYKNALGSIKPKKIDQIAYTAGPGLLGALLIGENFAQGLALALDKPLIPVNHLEAHLMAPFLDGDELQFPFLTLLVSGGHSLIIDVKGLNDYEILGQSRDDAVGEAFDKVAKLIGLGYPGGPEIERMAQHGDSKKFKFPQPMLNSSGYDFSFSGLKTAVLYAVQEIDEITEVVQADISASFQHAATEVLIKKISKALIDTGREGIVLAGGVAANKLLRKKISALQENLNIKVLYPPIAHCTDNAAMIAYLGSLKANDATHSLKSHARPRWPLGSQ
ncbi:MAG: tRNA (adenosine(37)-N6)-threonylcarbamoyltransferase complex transferase subunit TsaD [SAR86 cluster bacterium]|jgi:N6-L-threonylcarbamoyladenine synthase|nr:tRNA (adenosine(37)-N6)-threonylcarbamoyltransferase complex transferase subunit TsaD [Gammaproteobacteria bacterium]MDG0966541.1 tRNA (adenosine(37)-N6)-threonylcarbamoyltransferase complex transferase subunit TsaD [SAR86 cluster bacterium]MDG2347620.1 tRNA (adenosine(37)-N6)-threonylcarbamoyltransferase complex transferase subunit TsaD [SAR86 cluster bacterium]